MKGPCILFLTALIFLVSCMQQKPQEVPADQRYYSIRQFAYDQWETFHGMPYTLERLSTLNGKTDSGMIAMTDLDWGSVFKIFFATDISDPKFLGKYKFSSFSEDLTGTVNFRYEAQEPQLLTRTLQFSADEFTGRIMHLYIETAQHDGFDSRRQELYYEPMKLLRITESSSSWVGPGKTFRVDYRFL